MSQQNNSNNKNESNSKALDLESLNTEYKNLLIEYKQSVSNYIDYLIQESKQSSKDGIPLPKINNPDMISIKHAAFWGISSLSQNNSQTLEECKASCANISGCSGATYNLTNGIAKCMLRKGDGNIVAGSPNDVAIVPKAKQLLNIVKIINDKLTQVNKKIQTLTQTVEKKFVSESEKIGKENNDLISQYKNLIEERLDIQRMLNEYQTLDEQQVEGNIHVTQNYYSFVLLMILAILFIIMLYKLSIPSIQPTSFLQNYGENYGQNYGQIYGQNYGQNYGQLGTSTYKIIFGIILLVLLLTYYNKLRDILHTNYTNSVDGVTNFLQWFNYTQ
jgi:hypothetical protein